MKIPKPYKYAGSTLAFALVLFVAAVAIWVWSINSISYSRADMPPNTVSCESTCADGRAILHYQCASGPVLCECICPPKADSDGDGDVDLADYGWFQGRFGGK